MRSWVFRHRLRLRVVYGPRPAPVLPLEGWDERARRKSGGLAPGEWTRRGDTVVLRPMAPPAA